jgi:hypothetical protein
MKTILQPEALYIRIIRKLRETIVDDEVVVEADEVDDEVEVDDLKRLTIKLMIKLII